MIVLNRHGITSLPSHHLMLPIVVDQLHISDIARALPSVTVRSRPYNRWSDLRR